jgi:membrane fusion protein, multidrug efflux system
MNTTFRQPMIATAVALTIGGAFLLHAVMPQARAQASKGPVQAAPATTGVDKGAPQRPRELTNPAPGAPAANDGDIRVLAMPAGETTLASPMAGRLVQLQGVIGQSFAAGAILAAFDCDEPRARQAMAQADLAGAIEQHEAKVRLQGLEQASDVEVAMAASAVAKGRGQVDMIKAQIGQCYVRAPWAGRVAKVHVRNHMALNSGTPMLDLVRAGQLKLKLNVPSRLLTTLHQGQAFSVRIDETGRQYEARVTAINSRIDAVSQTIEIEGQMAQVYPDLLPGMSGAARFAAPAPLALKK